MADIFHQFGGDLQISASGDLLLAGGPEVTLQRVLRRLLTNPGDYLWQLEYGAGLRQMVGQNPSLTGIQNIIRSQIFQEETVAPAPEPVITATQDAAGNVTAFIQYMDAVTGLVRTIPNIPVN